jgi:tRNA-2-methylthio-N6-dimethylallyladenosine synthase
MQKDVNRTWEVLIEGNSKKSDAEWQGRTTHNKMVIFAKSPNTQKGDYVHIHITECTSGTLKGIQVGEKIA